MNPAPDTRNVPESFTDNRLTHSNELPDPTPTYSVTVSAGGIRPIGIRDKNQDVATPPVLTVDPGEALALASALILAVSRWEGWN